MVILFGVLETFNIITFAPCKLKYLSENSICSNCLWIPHNGAVAWESGMGQVMHSFGLLLSLSVQRTECLTLCAAISSVL